MTSINTTSGMWFAIGYSEAKTDGLGAIWMNAEEAQIQIGVRLDGWYVPAENVEAYVSAMKAPPYNGSLPLHATVDELRLRAGLIEELMSILRVGGIDISEPAQQHFYDHYIRAQFFSGATSAVLADWVARFKAGRPILVTWENVYDPESKENQVLNPGNVFPAGRRDLAITVFPFVVTGRRYDGHSLVPTVEAVNW